MPDRRPSSYNQLRSNMVHPWESGPEFQMPCSHAAPIFLRSAVIPGGLPLKAEPGAHATYVSQNRYGSQCGDAEHSQTGSLRGGHRTRSHERGNCSGIPSQSSGQPQIVLLFSTAINLGSVRL